MRGRLIVVEGLDRAGKTVQCERLVSYLHSQHRQVKAMKFPERTTTIGKMIDSYLKSAETLPDSTIHLLFSANRWELAPQMLEDLENGIDLVVDRYVFSGAAFSAAKGLDLEWCKAPDQGLPVPDKVIFLDVSSDVAESRGGYGEERYEKKEFQQLVRKQFERLNTPDWSWISADGTIDDVTAAIKQAVDAAEIS